MAKFLGHVETTGTDALVVHGLQAGLILLVASWATFALRRSITRHMATRGADDDKHVATYRSLASLCVMVPAIAAAIHILGVNLTPLFATGGIFALAMGFGMKNVAENFIAGVMLRLEKIVGPGSVLELGGTMMTVKSMGLRSTKTDTYDGREVVVPNSELLRTPLGTFTLSDSNYRVHATFQVSSEADQSAVREAIMSALNKGDWTGQKSPPAISIDGFHDDLVCYSVFIWVDDPMKSRTTMDALNCEILKVLKESGLSLGVPKVNFEASSPQ